MTCPRCKNPMIVLELHEVEIDYCPSCSGIWLDAGELELLLGDSAEKDKLLNSFFVDPANQEKKLKCPICSKKMEKVYVGEERKILIDRCRFNHGLWFDKGELEETLKLSSLDKDNKVLGLLKEIFSNKPE